MPSCNKGGDKHRLLGDIRKACPGDGPHCAVQIAEGRPIARIFAEACACARASMLNPNAVLKTEVFERLTELGLYTLGHLPLDLDREIHAHLEVLTGAKFGQEPHAKTVPGLGWDGPYM